MSVKGERARGHRSGQASPWTVVWVTVFVVLGAALLTSVVVVGCQQERYDQSSADATVRSMVKMIEDGNPQLLPTLIHAQNEDMQRILDEATPILDRMYKLGLALQEKYPEEFDALVQRAIEKGKEKLDEATAGRADGDAWRDRVALLIADPFGMLEREMERVDTVYMTEDTYAVTIDDKPAFGAGMVIKRHEEDGKWYFEVPRAIPGLSKQLPQTQAEWRIMSAMLKSVANGVEWTEREITDEKDEGSLDEVWAYVVKNVAPNIVIQWGIYESVVERRKEREKGMVEGTRQ